MSDSPLSLLTVDRILEEQEVIDEALEDLLILPTAVALRRSLELLKAYFSREEIFLTQVELDREAYRSHMDDQQRIVRIASVELNSLKMPAASSSLSNHCSS